MWRNFPTKMVMMGRRGSREKRRNSNHKSPLGQKFVFRNYLRFYSKQFEKHQPGACTLKLHGEINGKIKRKV